MNPVIAQLAPDGLKIWLEVFFWLMGGIGAVIGCLVGIKSLRSSEEKQVSLNGQPLQVQESHAFATRPELTALAQKMDEELGRERGARKKIHEEIAAIQSSVSSIKTETDKQSADITEMKQDVKRANERIDTLPERTIRLLRETKGLI